MKIIDAFWEKRNLGVECKEVQIEESDSCTIIEEQLHDIAKTQYIVVKVPSGRADVMRCMTSLGYHFMEGSINITHDLKPVQLEGIQKRLNSAISYSLMDEADIDYMYEQIDTGIFKTDRICLDPHFSEEQATKRYAFWIKDEISRGAQAYKVLYKNDVIGFFTFKEIEPGIFYPFLAAVYEGCQQSSLGYFVIYKIVEESVKRGGRMISSFVSTNNLPVFKIHTNLGFKVSTINYIYVKHHD